MNSTNIIIRACNSLYSGVTRVPTILVCLSILFNFVSCSKKKQAMPMEILTAYYVNITQSSASNDDTTESTAQEAPVLSDLSISSTGTTSITLEQPTFTTAGNPTPTVNAYIGIDGTISVSGSTISNSIEGPVDVASGSYQFASLASNTNYRIIVIAENSQGYSVKQIAQSTQSIAPVLNDLSISSTDLTSITLEQPTFATAGNPTPSVSAYIGIDGTISVSGSTISNSIEGPVDVASGSYQFASLTANTSYRIIVVAENTEGYSVKQITQSTQSIAPVLNNLAIGSADSTSITINQPTFATAGNPTPTVNAYIGLDGTISVSGSTISNSLQGPISVASGSYQFASLASNTNYRVIVVAQNSEGYSVKQIAQSTDGIAPVLNNLAIGSADSTSITLNQPTFATAGNPTPTVNAYIGLDGTISVSGSTVSNSLQGPISVASGSYQFASLASNTNYRVIVVAQNSEGYSIKQIAQATSAGITVAIPLPNYSLRDINLNSTLTFTSATAGAQIQVGTSTNTSATVPDSWTTASSITLTSLGDTKLFARAEKDGTYSEVYSKVHTVSSGYKPAAGQAGSDAIHKDDASFLSWANGHANYTPGTDVDVGWQTPNLAYGQAVGTSFDIVCLGNSGQITLTFPNGIADKAGADFAVFENSFSNTFLEIAYVEVSSDGVNFVRFDTHSLTASPVNAFGAVDPTNINGFAGRYRQGYGNPFDLSDLLYKEAVRSGLVDLSDIQYVKVIDLLSGNAGSPVSDFDSFNNPIYDPYKTVGSGGFDLDAIGVLNEAD
ncbi:MAG: hypothetical protein AAF518_21785 [Spirochaetota bacterium]